MDINLLQGQTFDMSNTSKDVGRVAGEDGTSFALKHDLTSVNGAYRPLVRSELTNKVNVGPAFKGVLQAVQTINMQEVPKMQDIPVTAYGVVPQLSNLGVRSMPYGCESTLKEVHKRQKISSSSSSSSSKKDKAVAESTPQHKSSKTKSSSSKVIARAKVEEGVVAVATQGEESAKKHKKSKKSSK
jgi:hypothetical protein